MSWRLTAGLSLLGVLILVLLVFQTPFLRNTRDLAWYSWSRMVGDWLGVGSFEVARSVEDQLQDLQTENARLRAELVDYERVKRQLGTATFDGYESVSAEIVGRPLDVFRAEYVLNRGVRDGLSIGSPVVIRGSSLIGFISEVRERTAVLRLLFHPETQLPVEILAGETPGRALLRGKAYTTVEVVAIPNDTQVDVGSEIVTVGEGVLLPHGLYAGTVENVAPEEQEPYQVANISLPFDADDLRAVNVLILP